MEPRSADSHSMAINANKTVAGMVFGSSAEGLAESDELREEHGSAHHPRCRQIDGWQWRCQRIGRAWSDGPVTPTA